MHERIGLMHDRPVYTHGTIGLVHDIIDDVQDKRLIALNRFHD